ncbi:hypothetical protein F4679DRAFT_588640 [Xylaria curta]|nr:hypothetical protein F4679DRAFT_588640 [Xylaria curta]
MHMDRVPIHRVAQQILSNLVVFLTEENDSVLQKRVILLAAELNIHQLDGFASQDPQSTQKINEGLNTTAGLLAPASNIRTALRPEGMLPMTEITESPAFADLTFGLLREWWRFADSRTHAMVSAEYWKSRRLEAGLEHVEWTDGKLSEHG